MHDYSTTPLMCPSPMYCVHRAWRSRGARPMATNDESKWATIAEQTHYEPETPFQHCQVNRWVIKSLPLYGYLVRF